MNERIDAYCIAVKNEQIAQKLYELLAKAGHNTDSKNVFERLMIMESRHEEKVKAMFKKEFPDAQMNCSQVDFSRIHSEENFEDGLAALQFAISNEEKAFQHYTKLAEQSENEEVKTFFWELAEEEQNHKKFLEDEIARLNGTLTWYDESELNGIMEY
jgi:rubrerythrin